jgi:glycosyltransferase involved in cell wall biosynthesis
MNIVHLVGSGNLPRDPDREAVSGIVRVPLEVAKRQARLGSRVTVLAVSNASWTVMWEGVRLQSLRGADWAKFKVSRRTLDFRQHLPIWRALRSTPIDILHTHGYTYLRGLRARGRIIHVHSDPLYRFRGTEMSRQDFQRILESSDAQIAVSQYILNQLNQAFVGKGRTTLVRNGTVANIHDLQGTKAQRSAFRKEYGIPEHAFAIGFAGALVPEKGVIYLVEAFRDALRHNPGLHLVLAGDSNLWGGHYTVNAFDEGVAYRHAISGMLEDCGSQAHLIGKIPASKMPSLYAASDVMAVPSIWPEAFPLSALEAQAHGKPVIASNVGGLPEVVVDGSRGRLVPPANVVALRDAILQLASDPSETTRLGFNARAFADSWTWDDAVHSIMKIYDAVLSAG